MNKTELCNALNLAVDEVLNIYLFGSRVYGKHTPQSDYDYVVVVKSWETMEHKLTLNNTEKTFQKFSKEEFTVNAKKQVRL
jgi:predicted nucleotidyltransferase